MKANKKKEKKTFKGIAFDLKHLKVHLKKLNNFENIKLNLPLTGLTQPGTLVFPHNKRKKEKRKKSVKKSLTHQTNTKEEIIVQITDWTCQGIYTSLTKNCNKNKYKNKYRIGST